MMQPRITAVIPAYNAAKYVHLAIESVMSQTFPVEELIVVDDGSSDNTAETVLKLAERYKGKVRLVSQVNGGPGAARNHGVKLASGDWIALLDADDIWKLEKLEKQIPYTKDETIGIVQAWSPKEVSQPPTYIDFERLWTKNCVANSSVLIRKKAFEEVGGVDEDRALIAVEDYNLWLRVSFAGWKIVTHHEDLVEYRCAPGHLSSQLDRAIAAEFANLDNIADRLSLPAEKVQTKRMRLYGEMGRYLLYHRKQESARLLLSSALKDRFTPNRLFWWLATFVPSPVLNLRRKLPLKNGIAITEGKN